MNTNEILETNNIPLPPALVAWIREQARHRKMPLHLLAAAIIEESVQAPHVFAQRLARLGFPLTPQFYRK